MNSLRSEIQTKWKSRKLTTHKGHYGRVFVLAGSVAYSGAAYLSAAACLRAGAGLVTLAVPDKIYAVVARRQPEIIVKSFRSTPQGTLAFNNFKRIFEELKSQHVLALGPGLSQNLQTQKLIRKLTLNTALPLVLDADGLNAFCGKLRDFRKISGRAIVTPHPGEFVRLFGGELTASSDSRQKRALEVARKYGVVVVLKGHHTIVANPNGGIYENLTGNPGMATAGTGDVLTGMIAALLGQGFSMWDSARFSVYLHGISGDLAAKKKGQISLIAGDLIEFLPRAICSTFSK